MATQTTELTATQRLEIAYGILRRQRDLSIHQLRHDLQGVPLPAGYRDALETVNSLFEEFKEEAKAILTYATASKKQTDVMTIRDLTKIAQRMSRN